MEWLAGNLLLSYPFDDAVTDPLLTALFADALITSTIPGPYTLTVFNPQALTNGVVTIVSGSTPVLSGVPMTGSALGAYTVINAHDSSTGSSARFIVSTVALASYASLLTPAIFVPDVSNLENTVVSSLNGLTDDVTISFDKYINATPNGNLMTISAEEPADRVVCSDAAEVLTINGVAPDPFGSFNLGLDGCLRLIPNPAVSSQLIVADFCAPCVSTPLAQVVNTQLGIQASYFYHMAAIYQDQFNRYQVLVAALNHKLSLVGASLLIPGSGPTNTNPDTMIDVSGRAINRPYFSQLVLGVSNSSPFKISVAITATIGALGSVTEPVPGSGSIQRFLINGKLMDTFTPFPGTTTFTMVAREVVALSSELHINQIITAGPATGQWQVSVTVTFLAGPTSLPAPRTFTSSFPIQVLTALFTAPPATLS